jgi:phospholipid/cholesterol/gamma-HCH transport system permease protein
MTALSGRAGAVRRKDAGEPGSRLRRWVLAFGDMADFSWRVTARGPATARRYFTEVLRQATILARGSVIIVLVLVFAFGLVTGIESSYGARLVGAPSLAALGPALGGLRELTPYAFGYMMAAKVSTGYVAEIGTMRITEEIDALDVMGLDSVGYICTTRVLATWLILPLMYGIAVVVGYIASYISVVVQIAQVSAGGYLRLFWEFQSPSDLLFSAVKGMLMGTFVVLVGVYYGFRVRGGPVEVGAATARAMIINLLGVHFIGVLTSQAFWGSNARLPIGG